MSKIRNYLENADLGRLVAEEDANLADYYVNPERYVNRAINRNDPATFFIGPKGIGKSAILQMVRLNRESETPRIINITPNDLAFSALANIEIATPILRDHTKNQFIFKSLWDYVLSLEILKREYPNAANLVQALKNIVRDRHEKDAISLLKVSLNDDGSQQSLIERLLSLIDEVDLTSEVGSTKFSGKIEIKPGKGGNEKLKLLNLIHSVAKHVHENLKHPYYILIDDLDLNWSDTPTQNSFIATLFQALKNFSKPPNLKCVVSMRDEIFRSLPIQDKDKIHDWICHVDWDAETIKQMISQRIHHKLNVPLNEVWEVVFPDDAFEQLWNHSYGRPRELIRLASLCLSEGHRKGHNTVELEDIKTAIALFSKERIEELASEYVHKFPSLDLVIRKFSGWPKEFSYDKFVQDFVENRAIEIACNDGQSSRYSWVGGFEKDPTSLARYFLEMGFLLIKPSQRVQPQLYDFNNPQDVNSDTWFAIHQTYWAGLSLIGS